MSYVQMSGLIFLEHIAVCKSSNETVPTFLERREQQKQKAIVSINYLNES